MAKLDIICAHAAAGFSATKAQRYYTPRVPHPLGALSRPRRPVGPMRDGSGTGAPEPRALTAAETSADSSNRSLRTQIDRCRGRRTSCGRPLAPQAQRAPLCRGRNPLYPSPGLLPGLAAGRIAEAVAASTTEGRSDGGLARKKSRRYSRGVLTYPQGKPLKPSYAADRLLGPPKCSSARKTSCSPRCLNGSLALRWSGSQQ